MYSFFSNCSSHNPFTKSTFEIDLIIYCILTFQKWNFVKKKLAKKVDFRKFLDPIWDLVLKRVSKFVIPKFRDNLLVPKITKCGDLLYFYSQNINGSEHIIASDTFAYNTKKILKICKSSNIDFFIADFCHYCIFFVNIS